jgi:hypothetical protein
LCYVADTANAAEVAQAAILASQQKKQKQVTASTSTPAVLSAAPVLHGKSGTQSSVTETTATGDTTEYPRYR